MCFRNSSSSGGSHQNGFVSAPEVKVIMIILCCFIIFGIIALANVSITVRNGDIILFKLLVCFTCQAANYNGTNTCPGERDELESYHISLNYKCCFLLFAGFNPLVKQFKSSISNPS